MALKILVLGRLFSGLADGAARGVWDPRGVPAFRKLVEGLHEDPDIDVETVLFCKDPDSRFRKVSTFRTDEVGSVRVVPYLTPTSGRFRRVDRLVSEVWHLIEALRLARRSGARLVYATYAMVLPAAVLARWSAVPVVLRLMGVFPQHRRIAMGKGHGLFAWALRAPFRMVVCTEDGSDPEGLLPKITHRDSQRVVRLNGCDVPPSSDEAVPGESVRGERVRIVFLNRLETYKGAPEFVAAAIALAGDAPGQFLFDIVGDGPLRGELEARAVSDDIRFHGAVPHAEALRILRRSDICVSVNLHGNLSNANLEALACGCCLVRPTSDPSVPIDTSTDRILTAAIAPRFDRDELPVSLIDLLRRLSANRETIMAYRSASRRLAAGLLKPWTEVIAEDIRMLRDIADSG
jgi:glycosyltransferase involved in cell wall biosynthesis